MKHRTMGLIALVLAGMGQAVAAPVAATSPVPGGFDVPLTRGHVAVRLLAPGIVQLQRVQADGSTATPSLVIDPSATFDAAANAVAEGDGWALQSSQLSVHWKPATHALVLDDASGRQLLSVDVREWAAGRLVLRHAGGDAQYGLQGYDAFDTHAGGLLRSGSIVAAQGAQGKAGAPFVWSTAGYGVLVDALSPRFTLADDRIAVGAKPRVDTLYLLAGSPRDIFAALARVSGATPLFPRWAMGFTNSQWGIDENELRDIARTYREKHIPLDNFTFDFDWKAWGEDHYGEFRWNASKFPDGPNGQLKKDMDALGVHMSGIMKPRVHVDTEQGRYATDQGFWLASPKAAPDYFSKKTVRELDFSQPAVRTWFFNDTLKASFDSGIVGWWNDEADDVDAAHMDGQFMGMQQALYEGQRAHADERVWSVNRSFYLGAQRYAYGLWSGDIKTGFASMAGQRQRMLSAIDLGAMQWGMDGGGFHGHPTPENYARWIEFGAFTPIFRVHGDFNEKRQPWVYGPVAEQAATEAIRLRESLLPYVYAYEYQRHVDGVGLVRPLLFDWPRDTAVRNDVDAWMFGDWLLVSPVVKQGQKSKQIYLPPGRWLDFATGESFEGGRMIVKKLDDKTWRDIPLFVREGAIIPRVGLTDHADQPATTLTFHVFPTDHETRFDYYDDDGHTYAYEQGKYFRQALRVQRMGNRVVLHADAPLGKASPSVKSYLLDIHGMTVTAVRVNGRNLAKIDGNGVAQSPAGAGWSSEHDNYGDAVLVKIAAGQVVELELSAAESP